MPTHELKVALTGIFCPGILLSGGCRIRSRMTGVTSEVLGACTSVTSTFTSSIPNNSRVGESLARLSQFPIMCS